MISKDIIFTKEGTKGDNVFETVLKFDQNCTVAPLHSVLKLLSNVT